MASTQKPTSKHHEVKHQPKTSRDQKKNDQGLDDIETELVHRLEEHYGTEFTGDKAKFIKDNIAEEKKTAKDGDGSPMEEAQYDTLIGQLRYRWTNFDEKDDAPHKEAIRKALKDANVPASVSFPDEHTYLLNVGGKEDSGHVSQSTDAIVSAAKKLTGKEE